MRLDITLTSDLDMHSPLGNMAHLTLLLSNPSIQAHAYEQNLGAMDTLLTDSESVVCKIASKLRNARKRRKWVRFLEGNFSKSLITGIGSQLGVGLHHSTT